MNDLDALYKWFAGDGRPETDRILAAGLEHAEPTYAARIAMILLGRRRESAWTGLVANYDRLSPDLQRRLHQPSVLVRVGIATAMKSSASRSRENALALLAQHPCLQLSYLAADALRDSDPEIRTAAATALRNHAEQTIRSDNQARVGDSDPESAAARNELVQALGEALRSFDVHGCREVLEACLWFAKELGEPLWETLAANRSSCRHVVDQHLRAWNSPRLAGFLLMALARPAWRPVAKALLDSWSTPSEFVALMRNSDLLADPEIRRGLHHLTHPRWFVANVGALAQLPRDVRAQLPYWICHLGFSDAQRVHCLQNWQASRLPEVHRAAVYALASLDTPQAGRILSSVAARPCPMNRFAKWFVAGRRLTRAHGQTSPGAIANQAPAQSPN